MPAGERGHQEARTAAGTAERDWRPATNSKQELLASLRAIFDRWEKLLAGRTAEEITARRLPTDWSISDVIAHLMAWQQISIARLEAALLNAEPAYPEWLAGADPFFAEDHVDDFNARIYELHRGQSWSGLHRAWRDGFLRFLELGEAIPEKELLDTGRYPWPKGYALSAVLQGSCDHHHEHYEILSARLR